MQTPWILFAILAVIVGGFAALTFFYFESQEEAARQRDRIERLSGAVLEGQARERAREAGSEKRLASALAAVRQIVRAERTVTRSIVRREIRTAPARTVTATATVTRTETVRGGPPGVPPPGECVRVAGVELCRQEAAVGVSSLILGAGAFGFVRRARGGEHGSDSGI